MSAKNLRLIARGEASRTLYRREKIEKTDPDTGRRYNYWHTDIDIGIERGRVELYVDADALVELLGRRALNTKSGRSRLADGLIEARVTERRQTYKEGEPKT